MKNLTETMVDDAKNLATQKHAGQIRKNSGEPYITHPAAVVDIVKRTKGDSHKIDSLVAAAWTHDTLEDTDMTREDLLSQFGPEVMILVHELTSDEAELKRLGKTEYLKKKMSGISSWALVVKLADRLKI